jgi:hypothetical protein
MNNRTGKECKQIKCKNYGCYSHWGNHLGDSCLKECMNCKYAYVSQFSKQIKEVQNG